MFSLMKKKLQKILRILLFFPVLAIAASSISLTSIQVHSIYHHTRVVFSLNHTFHYNVFTLTNPDRLVVDLSRGKLVEPLSKIKLGDTVIKTIRAYRYGTEKLRIVFDLKQACTPKVYGLKPFGHYQHRLVVDLVPKQGAVAARPVVKRKVVKRKTVHNKAKHYYQKKVYHKPRKVVVLIDPGHGGQDPGATGPDGIHEKDVVLAVGKDLYYLLKKQPGIEPKLTRSGDYFVTLRGRLKLARKGSADIFISIHADAYKNRYSHGASVFALSRRGATTEAARWLAKKENYSELGGVDLKDKSYMLRSVLIDLSQTATIRDSLRLGGDVIRRLGKVAHLHHGRVEQARFVVLKSPDIPSLLVETGFISNRREERLLHSAFYQRKIALAIEQGVLTYLHQHPPRGTVFSKH